MAIPYVPTVWITGDVITQAKALNWETQYKTWQWDSPSSLTVATGAVTPTRNFHSLDTEGAAAADDLDTVNAGGVGDGFPLLLKAANVARVVTARDGTGNLLLSGDYALDATDKLLLLVRDGSNWVEVARGGGALERLFAASASDSSAAATTISSKAISGCTNKDTLLVRFSLRATTNNVASLTLLHGATTIAELSVQNPLIAGEDVVGEVYISERQDGASLYGHTNAIGTVAAPNRNWLVVAAGLSITGSWTLGLRHGGMAGGALLYNWSIYRLRGQ